MWIFYLGSTSSRAQANAQRKMSITNNEYAKQTIYKAALLMNLCTHTHAPCLMANHIWKFVYVNAEIQLAETHVLHLRSPFVVFISIISFGNHIHIQILRGNRFKTKTRPTLYLMLIVKIILFRFILFSFIYLFKRFLILHSSFLLRKYFRWLSELSESILWLAFVLIYLYYVIKSK